MSLRGKVDVEASVKRQLLNVSREQGMAFNVVLNWFALERFLYRLSRSAHADSFVLKGAMLYALWTGRTPRPTRDLDLLGYGEASAQRVARMVREVCLARVKPDGLAFDAEHIDVTPIRERQEYQGLRVRLQASLGKAVIPLQIDIAFGDAVTPAAEQVVYPTLLDLPAPMLRAYPKETVIAEKLQAMVALGMVNSRMGDFHDLWWLSERFKFSGRLLAAAISATFERRLTPIPGAVPQALTDEFASQTPTIAQWSAFLSRNRLDAGGRTFAAVIGDLRGFLWPPVAALATAQDWDQVWRPGGPWRPSAPPSLCAMGANPMPPPT